MAVPVFMTASPRDYRTHQRCIESVFRSGFDEVLVCCEPGTVMFGLSVPTLHHSSRQGQYRNFMCALRCGIDSEADRFITCEDDIVFCRRVAKLIDSLAWPGDNCGLVQLYSSAGYTHEGSAFRFNYPEGRRSMLVLQHAVDMLGACALLWKREAAIAVSDYARRHGWRGSSYLEASQVIREVDKKDADTFVGETLTKLKYTIWIHNPSLVDHIGEVSTLGHESDTPRRRALNWPGEEVSAFDCVAGETLCT